MGCLGAFAAVWLNRRLRGDDIARVVVDDVGATGTADSTGATLSRSRLDVSIGGRSLLWWVSRAVVVGVILEVAGTATWSSLLAVTEYGIAFAPGDLSVVVAIGQLASIFGRTIWFTSLAVLAGVWLPRSGRPIRLSRCAA